MAKPSVTYARETLLQCMEEIKPLLKIHWDEIALNKGTVPLAPDFIRYAQLDEWGKLLIVTARERGELRGYAVFFIDKQLHYRTTLWAESDVYYLHPDLRGKGLKGHGYGKALMDFAEDELRKMGVKIVHVRAKNDHPAAGRLWQAMGYRPIETVFAKSFIQK